MNQGDRDYMIILKGEPVKATVKNRLAKQEQDWQRQDRLKVGRSGVQDITHFRHQERYAQEKAALRRERYKQRRKNRTSFREGERQRRKDKAELWAIQTKGGFAGIADRENWPDWRRNKTERVSLREQKRRERNLALEARATQVDEPIAPIEQEGPNPPEVVEPVAPEQAQPLPEQAIRESTPEALEPEMFSNMENVLNHEEVDIFREYVAEKEMGELTRDEQVKLVSHAKAEISMTLNEGQPIVTKEYLEGMDLPKVLENYRKEKLNEAYKGFGLTKKERQAFERYTNEMDLSTDEKIALLQYLKADLFRGRSEMSYQKLQRHEDTILNFLKESRHPENIDKPKPGADLFVGMETNLNASELDFLRAQMVLRGSVNMDETYQRKLLTFVEDRILEKEEQPQTLNRITVKDIDAAIKAM
jgi:hypothetical protein